MTNPKDPRPLTAGVMGWPITHSKSPLIFDYWFRQKAIQGRYCHLAVEPTDFAEVFRALPKAGFRGVNVTVPHKMTALELADTASDTARRIGAANAISFQQDGSIHADNTDGYGFIENLRQHQPEWRPQSGSAVVLGAGGAAMAIVVALIEAGAPTIHLTNRTRHKAEALADRFGRKINVIDWDARSAVLADAATLVNTTSLGMVGQPPLEIALDDLPSSALVTDIVYSPLEPDLLKAARLRGNPVVDGLGMLLHQARPAFHAWFGSGPQVDNALRDRCLE